jgi:conjugal transfer pilus assembly protein TraE
MNAKHFLNNTDNAIHTSRVLLVVVAFLGALILFNSYEIHQIPLRERTVLIPTGLDRKVWFTGDKASDEYLKAVARDVVCLAFTYTPSNVRGNFAELLAYFPPELFTVNQKSYYALADTINKQGVASVFYLQDSKVNPLTNEIVVKGQRNLYSLQSIQAMRSETYSCRLHFEIRNGKFVLLQITDSTGVDPSVPVN